MFFINEIHVYLRVYSVERGGPCFMHLSNTKHRANDFRTLDSFWITLIKLPKACMGASLKTGN